VCIALRERTGHDRVALSGGVFANAILATELPARLADAGFRVYTHRLLPTNDGGLCLGQLAVAAHGGGFRSTSAREAS
jgi:hydrogenase maturation protein HypF